MKPIRPNTILVSTLALAGLCSLSAQTNAPSTEIDDEDTVVLSPFEVTATEDSGYAATETLAGTRIRTELRDVGGAISVITEEFLRDIGATDNSTLLQYTPNAEVAGTRGTYAGLGNGTGVDESGSLRAPGGAQRVRGLAAADNTRDFFVTDIPWDSYNVDRIDIQRGPNAILFGLGSPAGIVNSSLKDAAFRDSGEVSLRVGSYASIRGTLDINKELINDTLAVRFSALFDQEKFQQDPAFEDDERFYGALRWEPKLFANGRTTIRAKYEHGDINANRPRIVPPNDNISAWFRPAAVSAANPFGGMGKLAVASGYESFTTLQSSASDLYNPYVASMVNQQQPFWLIDGASAETYDVIGGYINPGALNPNGTVRGASQGIAGKTYGDQFFGVAGLPQAANGLQLPLSQYGQYRNESLTDPSIFDFYTKLIDGNNKSEFENWDAYNIDVSQTFLNDRLGFQFTYDKQEYARGGESFLNGTPTLTVDILRNYLDYYLTAPNTAGTTNANFGRPYVATNGGGGTSYESDREYLRGALFAEVRAEDMFERDSLITKILGKHRFNAVYSSEDYQTENRGWVNFANPQYWAGYWNGNNGSGSPITDRPPTAFVYLGDSIASLSSAAGANIPGITGSVTMDDAHAWVFDSTWNGGSIAPNAPWTPPANLETVYQPDSPPQTAGWLQNSNPANYAGWNRYGIALLRYDDGADPTLTTSAQQALRKTESQAVSWQGFLWNNAIVPTLGWRSDEVESFGVSARQQPSNRSILNLSSSTVNNTLPYVMPTDSTIAANQGYSYFEDESTSGGVVVHLNRLFGDNDMLPLNVSLSYNKSNNFQVTDTRRDLYGNVLDNPTGQTEDYGVLLSTKDGRYSFRAIKYETTVKNASSGLSNPGGIGAVIRQGLRFRNVFLYDLGAYDWNTRDAPQGRNTWGGSTERGDPVNGADQSLTPEQGRALEDAAITTWNEIQAWLTPKGFFEAWGFTPVDLADLTDRSTYEANPAAHQPSDTSQVYAYGSSEPQGFTVTADTLSKGYEFELTANPTPNWRVAFNASQTESSRSNVGGPLLDEFIAYLDTQLTGTPAGNMPQFGNTSLSIYGNVYGPWRANYALMKLQEGTRAPEIRKWRYNVVTNYTFSEGLLKNVGIGASYRWQDKVAIGYPLVPLSATEYTFDLTKPYYGPAEDALDLWVSYEKKLTEKIDWRVQLNVRNAFDGRDLIPISVQPDGQTWASVRVAPQQEFFLTNTFAF